MMDVGEWQGRLEKHFSVNGVIGGSLVGIIQQEQQYGIFIEKTFHGQSVLMNSFLGFFVDTFKLIQQKAIAEGWREDFPYYCSTVIFYLTIFKRFRAAENLIRCGYPLDGYSLLRDLKDKSIFMAAIGQGITTLQKIIGEFEGDKLDEEKYKEVKKKRKKEEYNVLNTMIRKDSGFSEDTLQELERWENIFHEEVHGSKMSFFIEMGNWRKDGQLYVAPVPNESAYGMYMNRASEIGWLVTRLLPLLQNEPKSFGEEWVEKWYVLDDSFRHIVEGLRDLGKKIGAAFIEFIDTKFPFSPDYHYIE